MIKTCVSTIAAGLALMLGSCGGSVGGAVEPTAEQAASPNGETCRDEKPLGSNISHRVCRDDDDARQTREQSQQFLREQRGRGERAP